MIFESSILSLNYTFQMLYKTNANQFNDDKYQVIHWYV